MISSLKAWLRRKWQRSHGGGRRHRPARRWRLGPLEVLEDRRTPSTFTVTNTNDSGAGSFRQAILDANADQGAGADQIQFAIGAGFWQTISPINPLPTITHTVNIDGTTQPFYGLVGLPLITLDGSKSAPGDGLDFSSANNTVRGLAIGNWSGNGIDLGGSGGDLIVGDIIGTNSFGLTAQPNGGDGVYMNSTGNTIGGASPAAAT